MYKTDKKNEAKRVIAITFTIKKVGRAITKSGAIEKSSILLSKYQNLTFNYSTFWGHQYHFEDYTVHCKDSNIIGESKIQKYFGSNKL